MDIRVEDAVPVDRFPEEGPDRSAGSIPSGARSFRDEVVERHSFCPLRREHRSRAELRDDAGDEHVRSASEELPELRLVARFERVVAFLENAVADFRKDDAWRLSACGD